MTVIAVVLAALLVWLIVALAPNYPTEPQGILLPAKNVLPATSPDSVHFYSRPPADFKNLGIINIQMHYDKHSDSPNSKLYAKAQSLASSVGADGFLVGELFKAPSQEGAGLDNYYFYGIAISTSSLPSPDDKAAFSQRFPQEF